MYMAGAPVPGSTGLDTLVLGVACASVSFCYAWGETAGPTVWWDGRLVAVEPVPYRMDATFTPRWVPWDRAADTLRLLGDTSGPAFRVGR